MSLINSLIKRKIVTFTLVGLVGLFSIGSYYYFKIYNSLTVITLHGSYKTVNSFEELEKTADVIVIGTPVKGEGITKHTNYQTGSLQDVYTLREFKVDQVIKKPSDLNISKTMTVIEPNGTIQKLTGKYKVEIEGYKDLDQGSKYVLYLGKNINGDYSIKYNTNGSYKLDGNDLAPDTENQNLKIKNEVINKYRNLKKE